MSEDFLADFSEDKSTKTETVEVEQTEDKIDMATQDTTATGVSESDQAFLDGLAKNFGIDIKVAVDEFLKNINDKAISKFPMERRTTLARSLVKATLQKLGSLQYYDFVVYGKNILLSRNTGKAIVKVSGKVGYMDDNGNEMKEDTFILGIPQTKDEKLYGGIMEAQPFHKYKVQLNKYWSSKESRMVFNLTDYTSFANGDRVVSDGKSELDLFRQIMGLEVHDSYMKAGTSRSLDNGYADEKDWKAVNVLLNNWIYYESPPEHPELNSVQLNGVDFEGNSIKVYTSNFDDIRQNFPDGSSGMISGVAIGVLSENDNGTFMSMYAFVPYEE
jgi:hypothetical protein